MGWPGPRQGGRMNFGGAAGRPRGSDCVEGEAVPFFLLIPIIGAILWFVLGKDRSSGRGQARRMAPDDDPAFLRRLGTDQEQDERIRKLEQELAELDDDSKD